MSEVDELEILIRSAATGGLATAGAEALPVEMTALTNICKEAVPNV